MANQKLTEKVIKQTEILGKFKKTGVVADEAADQMKEVGEQVNSNEIPMCKSMEQKSFPITEQSFQAVTGPLQQANEQFKIDELK